MHLLGMIIACPTVHVYLIASRTLSAKVGFVECHVVTVCITLHQYHMRERMSSASGEGEWGGGDYSKRHFCIGSSFFGQSSTVQ